MHMVPDFAAYGEEHCATATRPILGTGVGKGRELCVRRGAGMCACGAWLPCACIMARDTHDTKMNGLFICGS